MRNGCGRYSTNSPLIMQQQIPPGDLRLFYQMDRGDYAPRTNNKGITNELICSKCFRTMDYLTSYIQIKGIILKVQYCAKYWKPLESGQLHTIHKGMVWLNALISHYYSYFMHMMINKQNGNSIFPLS